MSTHDEPGLKRDFRELLRGQPKCPVGSDWTTWTRGLPAACTAYATRVLEDGQLRCDLHSTTPFISQGTFTDLPTAEVIRRVTTRCGMRHVHGMLCRRHKDESYLPCTLKAGHPGDHDIQHDCGLLDRTDV